MRRASTDVMQLIHWFLFIIPVVAGLATATHALLQKRDPRAAMGWIAVCIMFPYLGPVLYLMFGINRIQTRARKLHSQSTPPVARDSCTPAEGDVVASIDVPPEFSELARISNAVTGRDLVHGNTITVLHNG